MESTDATNTSEAIAGEDAGSWQKLSEAVIGGPGFTERFMPTDDQVAARLNATGHGALGARQFGYAGDASGQFIGQTIGGEHPETEHETD